MAITKTQKIIAAVVVAGGAALYGSGVLSSSMERTAPEDILVSPEWVQERSDEVVILDVGREFDDFSAGHVPGAAFVDQSVIAEEVDGVSAMLPDPDTVAADLAEVGVSEDTPVVVYDGGAGTWSSRLFWALEYIGHEQVHLLDGGMTAWEQSGSRISTEVDVPERGDFDANVRPQLLADFEYVEDNLDSEEVLLLDARSPEEYRGEDVRAERGGHIPGSVNLNWTNNTPEDDVRFRPLEELSAVYEEAMQGHEGETVTLCQGGFRSAHSYVALRVLGHEDARMYDGSWGEWGNREDTPVDSDA
ncbi:MAG: sulfurtransferase [Spirochaetales bacterium]